MAALRHARVATGRGPDEIRGAAAGGARHGASTRGAASAKATRRAVNRLNAMVLLVLVLLASAVSTFVYSKDPVYWKRRTLAGLFSPANRPASYYEPMQLLEGVEGGPA